MPKHNENKENNRKERKRPLNSGKSRPNDVTETSTKRKKTVPKQIDEDTIAKSKQLSVKLKKTELTTRSSNKRNDSICRNGKPMPPLAILEKMFEDSDSDKEPNTSILIPAKSCQTPTNQDPTASEEMTLSPTTVQEITSRLIDKISNISDPRDILDVLPPAPIVPQKKKHKSDTPYIIGCKERPQLIKKPNTSFCKGDNYGIDFKETNDDEDCPKKRKRRSKKIYMSKSIFNAQTDEITASLKEKDKGESSNSSIETITYEYCNPTNNKSRAFSPLPSTSKDNDTIMKNEKLFNESISSDSSYNNTKNNHSEKDSEIKQISNNEIILNEVEVIHTPSSKVSKLNEDENTNASQHDVEVIETPYDTIVIDDVNDSPMTIPYYDDSCVQIVEPVKQNKIEDNSIIDVDDYYGSLNINRNYQPYTGDVEIIDIDSLTAESNAVLKNLHSSKRIDKVTVVEPSCLRTSSGNQVTEIKSLDAVNPVIIPGNPNNCINQQSSNNHSKTNEVITNISDTPHRYPNDHITTIDAGAQAHHVNQPCAVLSEENLRIHNSIQQKNQDYIGNIVLDFFKKNQYLQINSNNNTILPIPQNIRNIIANMHRMYGGATNNFQSDPRTVNTNRNNLSVNIPTSQSQNPSQPPEPKESSPQKKNLGDCPICMDSLFNNAIASTTCGHLFCMKCIKASLTTNGKRCPTCRTVLKGKSYHQIFI